MLNNIRVLSFTHYLQGPSAVQILADLGAEVIKVEPLGGAFERHSSGLNAFMEDVSVLFALGNRNQKSLSIDIRSDEGRQIVLRLIETADVLVENFRPGSLVKLGFGYDEVRKINPRLIYCSLTGYGATGPYSSRPGQDLLAQALSGLCYLTGTKDDPPTPVGTAIIDQHGAVLGALGIITALFHREHTGMGMKVDSNLLNAALDLQLESLAYYLNKGALWDRSQTGISTRFDLPPYGAFATKDDWIAISITPIEKLQAAFAQETFNLYSEKDQIEKRDEVNQAIAEIIVQKSYENWASIFDNHKIWYAHVNDYGDVVKDGQVIWNKMIISITHPDVGEIKVLNHPIRYNGEPPTNHHTYPPRIGEHTVDILMELGLAKEEIAQLQNNKVITVYQHE